MQQKRSSLRLKGFQSNLENNNFTHFYRNQFPNEYPFIYKKLHATMLTGFNEEVLNTIKSNKLRSYALFKTEAGWNIISGKLEM